MITPLLTSLALLFASPGTASLTESQCIERVKAHHSDLKVAELQVESARNKLRELESTFYPKLQVTTWVAPMFRVDGTALDASVDYHFKSLSDWGPYLHFEARLVQIISTFGRFDGLKEAAELNTQVEAAKRDLVEQALVAETKRMILGYRLILSLEKTVTTVVETLDKALDYARPAFEEGTGAITTIDLSRLEFGKSKALSFKNMLDEQRALITQGLRFLLHLESSTEVNFDFTKLPRLRKIPALPPLSQLFESARDHRPEWRQIRDGKRAYAALTEVEDKNLYLPYLFAAGEFSADWTPVRDDTPNPYHYDPYNGTWGGIALGLRWDLDWAKTQAHKEHWSLERRKLEALETKLESGVRAQLSALHAEATQAQKRSDIMNLGSRAARKWMLSASAGFSLGTASARDLLEGVIAYSEAKLGEASSVYDILIAHAELDRALGTPVASIGE